MFDPSIQDILTRSLQQLPALVLATSLRRDIDELVAAYFPSGSVAVIDDVNTSTAYGDLVFRALKGRYEAAHITLPQAVQADEAALAEIEGKSKRADLLVAVGSGTINDLVKYAAHKAGKPYIVFPTAASMNGYVSTNASIAFSGHKQSLAATLPIAVLVDMQLVAGAPTRLSQAGLGDSLARPTAQADWLLAHHLTGEAYDDTPYKLIAPYEPQVFGEAEAIMRGDAEAIRSLLTLLLLSGFGMTIAKSSRPASGAEHMVAHAYEMKTAQGAARSGGVWGKEPQRKHNLHGEEIAVTSVEMAARQAKLLVDSRWSIVGGKEKIVTIDHRPSTIDHAREAISAIHIAPEQLVQIRKKAGLPESIVKLGWEEAAYREALATARFTRERFTCLDVG